MDKQQVKRYLVRGFFFQLLLVGAMTHRFYYYGPEWGFRMTETDILSSVGRILYMIGSFIFIVCMVRIYLDNKNKGLITSGLFRYSRHPMYTGAVLMDLSFWLKPEYDTYFWLSALVFYASVFVAGYCQEQETLARYGKQAEEYYAKTPRLFLLYPFRFIFQRPAH